MNNIKEFYPYITFFVLCLPVIFWLCGFQFGKIKEKLHNPFNSKNFFVLFSATIFSGILILVVLVSLLRYAEIEVITLFSIMIFIFALRTFYYVFKGK